MILHTLLHRTVWKRGWSSAEEDNILRRPYCWLGEMLWRNHLLAEGADRHLNIADGGCRILQIRGCCTVGKK